MTVATDLRFVLITAARNEEALIGETIRSVLAQIHHPLRWIIVSDGSTDKTDEIVESYAARTPWIELLRMPPRAEREFGGKARAVNAAYNRIRSLEFEIVGNLDADITFEPDYFAILMERFAADSKLGVAGAPPVDDKAHPERHSYAHKGANLDHVSGPCQLFRRECWESVGGYVPVKGGGIDWIAVTTARMKGWKTRTFTETVCYHHRKMGTAESGDVMARFHYGRKAYYVGGHPVWEALRGIFDMRNPPRIIGGSAFIAGYFWAALTRMPRAVSPELMAFHRAEQMARLKRLLSRTEVAQPDSSKRAEV